MARPGPGRRGRPGRPSPTAVGAVVVVAALVALGLWGARVPGPPRPPQKVPTPVVLRAPTPAPTQRRGVARYGVGEVVVDYTEPGAFLEPPHSPLGNRPAPRTLQTTILYPAAPESASSPKETAPAAQEGAPPDRAGAPYPLVVFGPGYLQVPRDYQALLEAWASAGFVVVAPTFPLTNPAAPGGPDRADDVNQPVDMRFLIERVTELTDQPGNIFSGLVDTAEVAAAGQSDGGNTALALAEDSRYQSVRLQALLVLSGEKWRGFTGGVWFHGPRVPLLAVQGTADDINPPDRTDAYFASAPEPKTLVCLLGAGHLGPYETTDRDEQVVAAATIDFLDEHLYHLRGAEDAFLRAVDDPGVAEIASSCPTTAPSSAG